jgi:hypothetical protein
LPEKELKKKTELTGITDHDSKVRAVDTKSISTPLESNLSDVIEKLPVDSISSVDPVAEEIVELSEIEKKETKDKGTEPKDDRQIQDESEISKRVERLPEKLRKSLVEDYKVNFVSIEKIDSSQLI